MSLPEVGDLAVLVRPHCAAVARTCGGKIGKVTGFLPSILTTEVCGHCNKATFGPVITLEGWFGYWTQNQFDRIPPLSELESLEDSHDIPAPVEHA